MQEQTILYLLLGITTFDFLFDKTLSYLNDKNRKLPIPASLEGIYDEEQYKKSQEYHKVSNNFSILTSSISFILTMGMLYFGIFGWLDGCLRSVAPIDLIASLYFFGILYFVSDIVTIPFQLYSTFVIEEKFGFNKTTVKTFVMDKIKGYVMTLIIGGIILSTLIWLIFSMGQGFWLYFWIIISVIMVFINMFYTSLIVPIFNKLTPLEESELKSAIEDYSKKVSFPLTNIFVIDGSKRSSKGNAFFSGFGKKKKVVLYDTLIEKHTKEELVAVLAHEVGHFKKKHIIWSMIFGILQTGFMLYLLSLMIFNSEVSYAMGGQTTAIHLNILAFGILFSPLSKITGVLMNIFSRKNEYEADEYAVVTYDRKPLIDALKKLTSDSLGNLTPHPLYVFFNYSHPSLLQRVEAMERVKK
ncbi:M48 family metallopeptidase [Reichenbachiella sp. MALMAid0571]|uniref:M48 family metallopeptidase n=1 Tax=Reichenbachiella sp. MALMAid0571 TaxID=3143939 RepID=UPI0032DF8D4E